MSTVRALPMVEGLCGELELLARVLQDGTREWRKELGVVGRDALRYQENGDGRSIGLLLLHLADSEDWWIREVAAGKGPSPETRKRFLSEETNQYGGVWPSPPSYSLKEYYAMQDEIRSQTLSILREIGSADHLGAVPGGKRQFTQRWIVTHIIQHEPYHAGQMVMLKQQFLKQK